MWCAILLAFLEKRKDGQEEEGRKEGTEEEEGRTGEGRRTFMAWDKNTCIPSMLAFPFCVLFGVVCCQHRHLLYTGIPLHITLYLKQEKGMTSFLLL